MRENNPPALQADDIDREEDRQESSSSIATNKFERLSRLYQRQRRAALEITTPDAVEVNGYMRRYGNAPIDGNDDIFEFWKTNKSVGYMIYIFILTIFKSRYLEG